MFRPTNSWAGASQWFRPAFGNPALIYPVFEAYTRLDNAPQSGYERAYPIRLAVGAGRRAWGTQVPAGVAQW